MYVFLGLPGKIYGFIPNKIIKMNESYYGECDAKTFSENIRRLMHTGKYTWEQCIAITFQECAKGKAYKEGEHTEIK